MDWKSLVLGAIAGFAIAVAPSCGKVSACQATCSGCCTAAGACVAPSDSACGAKGTACSDCAAKGETCDSSTQVCVGGAGGGGAQSCSQTCTMGCCSGGLCLPFAAQESSHCGKEGSSCHGCSIGELCSEGQCKKADPSVTGEPCSDDSACSKLGDAGVCRKRTMPGGVPYPLGYCTRACQVLSNCAPDAVCVGPLPGESSPLCLKRCGEPDMQSTCRDDYYCFGLTSSQTEGACWLVEPFLPDAGPPFDKVGASCTTAASCDPIATTGVGRGICIPEQLDGGATGFTGGYCTGDCSIDPRVCSTDGGAVCAPVGNMKFLCERSCAQPGYGQSDCRQGYVCYGYSVRTPDGGLKQSATGACEPSCDVAGSLYGCAAGAYCDAGYCTR